MWSLSMGFSPAAIPSTSHMVTIWPIVDMKILIAAALSIRPETIGEMDGKRRRPLREPAATATVGEAFLNTTCIIWQMLSPLLSHLPSLCPRANTIWKNLTLHIERRYSMTLIAAGGRLEHTGDHSGFIMLQRAVPPLLARLVVSQVDRSVDSCLSLCVFFLRSSVDSDNMWRTAYC